MLQFVCHPAFENLLTTSREGMKCVTLLKNTILISDYLPKASQPIHAGLLDAAKYRLFHPSEFIFIASFFPKEKLLPFDTFGIISLTGTEFIRLPFIIEQFFDTLEEKQTSDLIISEAEWEEFSIILCKVLLKEKISVLKHGGKLDFVNNVSFALRNEAQNCLINPLRMVELKKLLVNIKSYNQKEEITELFDLSDVSKCLPDNLLQTVAGFVKGLKHLESLATEEEIDFHLFISDIDILNATSSKILIP